MHAFSRISRPFLLIACFTPHLMHRKGFKSEIPLGSNLMRPFSCWAQVVIKDALPARPGAADAGALRAAAQQLRLSTSTSSFLSPPDAAGHPPRPLRSHRSSDSLSGAPSAQVVHSP